MRWSRLPAVGSLVLACVATAWAQAPSTATNVRLTFEIGRLEGSKKVGSKTYEVLAPLRGKSNLNVSARVPIPTQLTPQASGGGGDSVPATAGYSTQNIGFSANIETQPAEGRRVYFLGRLDWSQLRNEAEARTGKAAAIIGSYSQETSATLQDGKTARLVTVDEPGSGAFYVEVTAKLVD